MTPYELGNACAEALLFKTAAAHSSGVKNFLRAVLRELKSPHGDNYVKIPTQSLLGGMTGWGSAYVYGDKKHRRKRSIVGAGLGAVGGLAISRVPAIRKALIRHLERHV